MELLALASALLDLPHVIAGHGYDVGVSSARGAGDDGARGIGTAYIVAALLVALVAGAGLVALNPSGALARLKAAMPIGMAVVLIVTPLALWSATSSGDRNPLSVDRANALTGAPELLVSLVDATVNTLATTDGEATIRVRCIDRDGRLVLDAQQKWPFVHERGYEYPHAHQLASVEQVLQADRCTVAGARIRLEADVKGRLTGGALGAG
jgi:hypothetical protein